MTPNESKIIAIEFLDIDKMPFAAIDAGGNVYNLEFCLKYTNHYYSQVGKIVITDHKTIEPGFLGSGTIWVKAGYSLREQNKNLCKIKKINPIFQEPIGEWAIEEETVYCEYCDDHFPKSAPCEHLYYNEHVCAW